MTQEPLDAFVPRFAPSFGQRFGPSALKALGIATRGLGPLSVATMGDGRPDNSSEDMTGLTGAYGAAREANRTPQGRINRGFNRFPVQFGPEAPPPYPMPEPVDMGTHAPPSQAPVPPVLSNAGPSPLYNAQGPAGPMGAPQTPPSPIGAPQSVPMPMARPAEAPQAPPEMPWWQRNSAMMSDPNGGGFIDPEGAARAQASGPDVINKLLSYFHNKGNQSA